MSDYIAYKLVGAIFMVIAAGIYGFWRGWSGKGLSEDDKPSDRHPKR